MAGPLWRYQPIVSIGSSYVLRFQSIVSPSLVLQLNNAEQSESVTVAVSVVFVVVLGCAKRKKEVHRGECWCDLFVFFFLMQCMYATRKAQLYNVCKGVTVDTRATLSLLLNLMPRILFVMLPHICSV